MKLQLEKLKYELDEKEIKQIKQIEDITGVDYEIKGNLIPLDSFICMAKDMLYEYHKIEEEKNDIEKDIEDNYTPIKPDYSYYGVSESDFH